MGSSVKSEKNGTSGFTQKMNEKKKNLYSTNDEWDRLEVDEDGMFSNPKLRGLIDLIDDVERGPKVIEIENDGVMEIVSEEVMGTVEEFKDIMGQCEQKLELMLGDFSELEDLTIGLNDEFVFLTDNFGNKPEDNKAFSDNVKTQMAKYDEAWIDHSPGEGKINPTPNISQKELDFGVQTYDMNFGNTVDIDGIYINGLSVKSIFSSVEPQNEAEAQKLTDYKKAYVTASAMGREDKIDFRFTDPDNAKKKSDLITLKTSAPNEMKNVTFWGEVGNFMSALGKGDFGKMKSCLDNLKVVTGLSSSKDKIHAQQIKNDATIDRSERRGKIEIDELTSDGKRVEKKRVGAVKLKTNNFKESEVTTDKIANEQKRKR
jgi:hypothetical protein